MAIYAAPVQQIQRYSMRADDVVGASDDAFAAICGEDDDGSDGRLEGSMKISETLDIQHVNFVDEENAGNQFRNS